MFWKNLKLRDKLSVAFGSLTVILILIAAWAIYGISGTLQNAGEMLEGNHLRSDLEQGYIQHLLLAGEIHTFLNDNDVKELSIETDAHNCDFGKWFYGEGRKHTEEIAPELSSILAKFEEPHEKFHLSALKIKEAYKSRNHYRTLRNAKKIYLKETKVHLSNIGKLFNTAIDESKNLIITDEQMIFKASVAKQGLIYLSIFSIMLSVLLAFIITRGIIKPIAKSLEFAKEISKGNLMACVHATGKDEISQLCLALSNMSAKLKAIVHEIRAGAENITTASSELSISSQKLSEGASQQASSAEEVSASMEEMTANIIQNSDNAKQTESIASMSSLEIKESNDSTKMSVNSMKEIADKTMTINDIASQTNLLALNAAIEAARAGIHGRGFAVVASEVQKLAERSKLAAHEINLLSKNGVTVSEESGAQLSALVPEVEKTAILVGAITSSSIEQKAGADQINSAIAQLNLVTQLNAASSEEMASGSEELASQAEQLKDLISFFKIGNDNSIQLDTTKNGEKNKNDELKINKPDYKLKPKKNGLEEGENKRKINEGVYISFDDVKEGEFEIFK